MSEDLRYPIGKFSFDAATGASARVASIQAIEELPVRLRQAIAGLNEEQLRTPYREGGWTVHQLIHHIADSHMNSFVRFKLALTEDKPTIKTYEEADWAETTDVTQVPVEISLKLLDALHERLFILLASLSDEAFRRQLNHPDHGLIDLEYLTAMYAWHSRHHTAHITNLREKKNW
ncbi:MAG: putative metal-dependent hydrolase [Acidobacteriota bacterium]|nr:putative metal-dependent hydrolase [Acidobacteriota bacterium]